jgi:hypothetical protein
VTAPLSSRVQLDAFIARIEQAVRDGDRALQSQLVLQSADLLTRRWSRLPVAEKPAFDALLLGLCGQIDAVAREAFSERLADLRLGPPRTTRALAQDASASIAAPLLKRCVSLPPDCLSAIAEQGSEAHRFALASRAELAATVTDILVRRGGGAVAARLLDNPGARFSEIGLAGLMEHARESEAVTLRLVLRPDLTPMHRSALRALTRTRTLAELRFDLDGDDAGETLIATVTEILAQPVSEPRLSRFGASEAFVRQRFAAVPPEMGHLQRWAVLRRIEDARRRTAAAPHRRGLRCGGSVGAHRDPARVGGALDPAQDPADPASRHRYRRHDQRQSLCVSPRPRSARRPPPDSPRGPRPGASRLPRRRSRVAAIASNPSRRATDPASMNGAPSCPGRGQAPAPSHRAAQVAPRMPSFHD